ncbi:glycoside hydrolase family 15 protein, partial [Streptomyces albidoflavus]|uniref:glycoside hydrolase family 15 protein n=1 Tax=Streptomyces albidoflavus TaxID=1886 RepID=UPI00332357EC
VTEALHLAHMTGLTRNDYAMGLQLKLIEYLEKHWEEPDEGIWEVRGPRRHFVHSKVMAWVAVDRTIKLIEAGDAEGPLERWHRLRDDIHRDVCERGYDKERNTFTQSYGSRELVAAAQLIVRTGFLPCDDPRVIGTVDAVRDELGADGLVRRYSTEGGSVDGLPGDEGAFVVCSFWLVDALALTGQIADARLLFERLLTLRSDLGLLAEEYDPVSGRQLGNFPQAFSHIGLVESAATLCSVECATAPVMAA